MNEISVAETVAFVRASASRLPASILDVGCGNAAVSFALREVGFSVLAIDEDESSVSQARRRGVNAVATRWLAFLPRPFSVVLFNRSLHHIRPTDDAVLHAVACLASDGIVIVEDFAFKEFQAPFIAWFHEVLNKIKASGQELSSNSFVASLAVERDPIAVWRSQHGDELTSATEIENALRKYFDFVEVLDAPYLYRYVEAAIPSVPSTEMLVEKLRLAEVTFAAKTGLRLLGRRYVCKQPAPIANLTHEVEIRGGS